MKRTFATLGVVGLGLGLISVTAPAIAASDRITVCHTDGSSWTPLEFDVNGVGGHDEHPTDIIPPTPKLPGGKNWTNAGKLLYVDKCAELPPGEVIDPVVAPPAEQPPIVVDPVVEQPVVEQPVVQQPVVEQPVVEPPAVVTPVVDTPVAPVEQAAVVPPVTVPRAAVPPAAAPVVVPQQQAPAVSGAAATTSLGTNQGYNAQTAVGGSSSPSWLVGIGALVAAGVAVAFRRTRRALPIAG